jgi:LmbE family N-acetylglucosaminyl deacetylase
MSVTKKFSYLIFLWIIFGISLNTYAQGPKIYPAGELQLALKKMNTVGSVLYIAAHPDDENTALLAMLANDRLLRTAYLSLTRGDGGQNLIGPEQRELMGLIRTQELLQARRTDGGEQFFTRANDFGFSKDASESFEIWDKEKVLADAVWIIRSYRPDVIITRFPPTKDAGHGHHEASSIIAIEAFKAAADPARFPEQLKYVQVWQAKRLLWNSYSRRNGNFSNLPPDDGQYIPIELGTYNPLLGKSHLVVAAESRSMHKSQGFGAAKPHGGRIDNLKHLDGEVAKNDVMDGIDLTWNRIKGGKEIGALLQKAYQNFKPENPTTILPDLLKALEKINQNNTQDYESQHWLNHKKKKLEIIIQQCAGLWLDANGKDFSASPNDSVLVELEIVKQLPSEVSVWKVEVLYKNKSLYTLDTLPKLLVTNELFEPKLAFKLPQDAAITQPYWLVDEPTLGLFQVNDQSLIGKPENESALQVAITFTISGQTIRYQQPVTHKWVKADDKELYRSFEIRPSVMVTPEEKILMFADASTQTLKVTLKAGSNQVKGALIPTIPQGWKLTPTQINFDLAAKGQEEVFAFQIMPPSQAQAVEMSFKVQLEGETEAKPAFGMQNIDYAHIPIQTVFPDAKVKLTRLDMLIAGKKIGYIAGAGDEIPQNLRQVGYEVTLLDDKSVQGDLSRFDAIVAGVRAYNTQDWLKYRQDDLLKYVENGGVLITQYHTPWRMVVDKLGPYPFEISRDRVTVEEAPITFLKKEHPLLNYPNKITEKDFEGWVQERGLYFAEKWDEHYETIFSCHDPNEKPSEGSLIYANYGKGRFIYTGLSFFRELPAGVSGAYRLFANLMAKEEDKMSGEK